MNILKKTTLALAVTGAMASAPAMALPGILFDFGGLGNGGTAIDELTANNATVLGQNSVSGAATSLTFSADGTRLFGQGQINAASYLTVGLTAAGVVNNLGFFTYQFSMPVNADFPNGNAPGTLTWDQGGTPNYGSANYFRMFYTSPSVVNASSGTGFGDATGTLILEGKITINTNGANVAINNTNTQLLSSNSTGTLGTIPTFGMGGSVNFDVDVCNADEISGGATPSTACGALGAISFVSTNFFRSIVDTVEIDQVFTDNVTAPFGNRAAPGSVVGQTVDIGRTNDFACAGATGGSPCDVLLSGTPSSINFNGEFAPEPGSLALLGLGLAGLGATLRRRRGKGVQS